MSTIHRCDLCGATTRAKGDIEAMHLGNKEYQWQGGVCKRCRNRISGARVKAEIAEIQAIKDEIEVEEA